jgi:hypothetical protein
MKTTIKSIMILLICFITLNANAAPKEPKAFIEGVFLNQSFVSYTLYEVLENNEYKIVTSAVSRRNYRLGFSINKEYVLKFEDKNGKIKYMSFIAYDSANIIIDVDFKSDKSINLVYDGEEVLISDIDETLVLAGK